MCASCSFSTKKLAHSMCQVSLVIKYIIVEWICTILIERVHYSFMVCKDLALFQSILNENF